MAESFNFSPGPSMLPRSVIHQAKEQLIDFKSGMSAMEISHRHSHFLDLLDEINNNLIQLLNIPKNYKILWTTGGATAQFALVPLNLLGKHSAEKALLNKDIVADYFCTGYWSQRAITSAEKYITINKVVDNKSHDYTFVEAATQWQFSENPLYVYYTPNETISGLRFKAELDLQKIFVNNQRQIPLVADMTSYLLSEPIDISKFGIIFASAQKNLGPSGVTLIIIREDLLNDSEYLPDIFNYKVLAENNSLVNTPPVYNLSIINLVLQWLIDLGGVNKIKALNQAKADKLYDFIDKSSFYYNRIVPEFRSRMNVTFDFRRAATPSSNPQLAKKFINDAECRNLYNLEGHRSLGGFRASIYNAMPMAGIDALIEFMSDFAVSN